MQTPKSLHFATRFIARTGLKLKGASPTLLTIGGIAALVTASVLAVKATPQMDAVASDLDHDLRDLDYEGTVLLPDERVKAKVDSYANAIGRTLRIYGPSLALGTVGIAAILYSHGLMRKRNAALVAAYGILERGFNSYRDRVRDSFGEEVEERLYEGRTVQATNVDPSTGKLSVVPVAPGEPSGRSEYAVAFGPGNPHWNPTLPDYNLVFLRSRQSYANHLLNARGHILLNDVYDMLGVDRTPAGCVVGWVRNGEDGYVDFGLPEPGTAEESDYFYFYDGEGPIYLDFNVDGLVYEKI